MTSARAPSFSLQALAAEWRAIVLMLILVGRQVSAGQKLARHDGYAKAAQMELWGHAALGGLGQQLAVLQDLPQPETPDDAHALEHLKVLYVLLLALTMLAAKMKREARAFAGGAALPGALEAATTDFAPAAILYDLDFLDSS